MSAYTKMHEEPVQSDESQFPAGNDDVQAPVTQTAANASRIQNEKSAINSHSAVPVTGIEGIEIRDGSMLIVVDPEDLKNIAFDDESIRKGFIRKVYLILMSQLLLTTGIICIFLFHEPTKLFAQQHTELFGVAFVFYFVLLCSMACCETVRRTFPLNFICLGLFTLANSFMLGLLTSLLDVDVVVMAVGITALLCFTLTLYAVQTKYDFTTWGGFLLCSVICLIMLGVVAIIWPGRALNMVYSVVGALLSCLYLIYDTQLMMGGKHKYTISPEEYIFAALSLYIDVIRIFVFILRLLAGRR